jgi:hypothetical protein
VSPGRGGSADGRVHLTLARPSVSLRNYPQINDL